MAITNAQQYKQLLSNGGSTNDISLKEAKDMAPKGEFLAYINKKEAKMLKDAGGSGIMTNAGIPSFRPQDYGDEAKGTGAYAGKQESNYQSAAFDSGSPNRTTSSGADDRGSPIQNYNTGRIDPNKVAPPPLTDRDKSFYRENPSRKPFQFPNFRPIVNKGINFLGKSYYNRFPNNPEMEFNFINQLDEEEYDDLPQSLKDAFEKTKTSPAIKSGKEYKDFDKLSFEDFSVLSKNPDFKEYAKERGSPGLSVSGDMSKVGNKFVKRDPITKEAIRDPKTGQILYGYYPVREGGGGDGMSDYERRLLAMEQAIAANASATPEVEVEEDPIINYRLMADGGRAGFKDGEGIMQMASSPDPMDERNMVMETIAMQEFGKPLSDLSEDEIIQIEMFMDEMSKRKNEPRVMAQQGGRMMNDDDPTGGIMDLESGRQMYFLGKLVKKATRAVKKIVKSPIGKAALIGGLGLGFSNMGGLAGLKGALFGTAGGAANMTPGFLGKLGLTGGGGSMGLTGLGKFALAGGLTAAPFLFGGDDTEEDQPLYAGADIDDPRTIMNNPYKYINRRLVADGGIMRLNYAEGSEEPVAKKTMPLLDMDGQEMDLREEGGFVPLGRMERADDVPARLSKNEFVFTADAVRNAGEGDVDKGAEVMYNMMKNLESGGEVSEESQGLEGAKEMFQTSQRLEEVL